MLLSAQRVGSVFLLCILVRRLWGQISLAEMYKALLSAWCLVVVVGGDAAGREEVTPPPVTPDQVGMLQCQCISPVLTGAGGCASEVAQTCGWRVDAGCGQEASVLTTGLLECPHGQLAGFP